MGDLDLKREYPKEKHKLLEWLDFFKTAHQKDRIPPAASKDIKEAYEMLTKNYLEVHHKGLWEEVITNSDSLSEHNQVWLQKDLEEGHNKGLEEGLEKTFQKLRQSGLQISEEIEAKVRSQIK